MNTFILNFMARFVPTVFAAAVGVLLLFAGEMVRASAVVFEADFNGSGGAEGGSANMVTYGGTASGLFSNATFQATVIGITPFIPGGGNYLNNHYFNAGPSGQNVTFTPDSTTNSFASFVGPSIVSGGLTNLNLNGGYDVFVRLNVADTGGNGGWFGVINALNNISGSTGISLGFNGIGGGNLRLQLSAGNANAIRNFTKVYSVNGFGGQLGSTVYGDSTSGLLSNTGVWHIGFTFSTDANGLITMKTFMVAGTGAIDTTSANNLLFEATFNFDATTAGTNPLGGTWKMASNASASGVDADFDTMRLYSGTVTNFSAGATNTLPAVLLKVSDGVAAGRSFNINGEALYPPGMNLAIAPDNTGLSPATPPTNAIYPAIIQTDANGHFMVARMPAGVVPGVYNLWVSNNVGWSSCIKMNAARALFMSDYQAYNGLDIEVVGRNFDQAEFGGTTATQVRLNDGNGTTYNMPVKDLNPYHVTFTVGSQPLGTYYVEVSSDNGVNWSRLTSGQTLTLLAAPPAGSDPLGLAVSWAANFNWTNVFNVTNYGVNTNGSGDVTVAVQNAVNAAESSGGGVVYFPNGSYYIQTISLGAGVVLEGQDQYNTKLYYNGTGGGVFINTKGTGSKGGIPQLQGVARMSILLSNPSSTNARPDMFIFLGNPWGNGVSDETVRTGNRMFVTSVNLSYPYTNGDSNVSDGRRGLGILWVGKERVLVKDNHFTGWSASPADGTYLSQYCILKNNYTEYSMGYTHDTANYLFFENNYLKIHPEYDQDSHGYFGRADAYMAGNYVEGAGDASNVQSDGEGYCVEAPGGAYNYGAVTAATSNSITVAPVIPLVNPTIYYGNLSIAITCGRGLGQMEPVASVNTNTGIITLAQPFNIIPDKTSIFTLYAPLQNWTVYSNTLVNCASGLLPYGAQYDGVVANNTSIDTAGVFLWSARSGPPANPNYAGDLPNCFMRITRNTVTGVSRRGQCGGIGLYTGRFDSAKFYDVEAYATEITANNVGANNTVIPNVPPGNDPYSGIFISSYPFSTMSDGTGTGDATGTLMESNQLSNLPVGFTLTKCNYGQLVNANTYDSSVLTLLSNYTGIADNTIITSNLFVSGSTIPTITTQPQSQSVLVGETPTFTVLASGTPAPFYQWFKNSVAIAGANSASYTTPSVTLGDNGEQFSVTVSNSAGGLLSSNALLTVSAAPVAPVITSQPQGQTVSIGSSATFTVGASALPSPSYQWQTNGVNIPGACAASYTTPLLTASNNGTLFSCLVANSAGSTNSVSVVLGVVDPTPSLADGAMSSGGQFQLLLQGAPGRIYNIQASTNLATTNWVLLSSVTLTNTSVYFLDASSTNLSQRYYRAILLP